MDLVSDGKLSAGHARCLVVVEKDIDQASLADECIKKDLNVRDFEKLVKNYLKPAVEVKREKKEQSLEMIDLIQRMQRVFATKVSAVGNDNKGRIYIDYYTRDDLDRIVEMIESIEREEN